MFAATVKGFLSECCGYVHEAKSPALAELESMRITIDRTKGNKAAYSKGVTGCRDVFLHILNNMGSTPGPKCDL